MRKPSAVQVIMDETILFGGLRATRGEVYADCVERGLGWKVADYYACRPGAVAVDPASVAHLPTLADIRAGEEIQRPFREWCDAFLNAWRARTRTDFLQPWESIRKFFERGYLPETAAYELAGT